MHAVIEGIPETCCREILSREQPRSYMVTSDDGTDYIQNTRKPLPVTEPKPSSKQQTMEIPPTPFERWKGGTTWTRTSRGGWCIAFQTGAMRWFKPGKATQLVTQRTPLDKAVLSFKVNGKWLFFKFRKLCWAAPSHLWFVFCFFPNFFCKLNSCNLVKISWLQIKCFVVRFCVQQDLT